MRRARIILEEGELRPFEPVDREAQFRRGQEEGLEERLDDFARLRGENLKALEALQLKPEDLDKRGRHPAFGIVTLSQLLATWTAHDLTHLHQLSRVMAHRYREEVGPWAAYLGVMKCSGHGG
jgi:hypothetical protein